MSETIDRIRELLSLLEEELGLNGEVNTLSHLDALELPGLISAVVDHLQPLLLPYEAAIYWWLFRRSIVATGQPLVRASVRGLQKGVILSSSGQSATLSYASIQEALSGLEQKGAILKVGEPNREGTLYRLRLPEEIEVCREHMATQKVSIDEPASTAGEDFYNVPENRMRVFERDKYTCRYCGKLLTRFSATLDHQHPVSEGGDNSFENLVTACLSCNSRKTNRPIMDLLRKSPGSSI
ncbi:MAG TPA: HNH endonuclease [Holophagaceae bacterium]|nr:HNH endonuclease [Holophagaceae bacterium]